MTPREHIAGTDSEAYGHKRMCAFVSLGLQGVLNLNDAQVEQLEDPVLPASEVVARCGRCQLMQLYKVPVYEGAEQLLRHIALARGKLHKGGTPDIEVRPDLARFCAQSLHIVKSAIVSPRAGEMSSSSSKRIRWSSF